jgi:integrase
MKRKSARWRVTSDYGVVSIYVPRHVRGCELSDRNDVNCNCPKWIYHRGKKGGKAVQVAAGVTSLIEASAKAREILRGFDPEIAAAREKKNPASKQDNGIETVVAAYEAALNRRAVGAKYISRTLLLFKRRNPMEYRTDKGRALNLSLLDFLDRENVAAREPVVRMDQITSNTLDKWSAGWRTNDSTSRAWRGKVGTWLRWAQAHDYIERLPVFREKQRVRPGNRTGHLSDAEVARLYAALPFYRTKNHHKMPENYAARLGAFLDLARHGGLAVVDIVAFAPRTNIAANNVLTYRRQKFGQIASVLLPPEVAQRLRSIPPEKGSDPNRPFMFPGAEPEANRQTWRSRFQRLCAFAGIKEVETEVGARKPPRPHQLRDSFAISAIVNGVAVDNVAKMCGHASSQMTEKNYLFWIKQRLDACVEDQRRALDRAAAAREAEAAEPEAEPATVN